MSVASLSGGGERGPDWAQRSAQAKQCVKQAVESLVDDLLEWERIESERQVCAWRGLCGARSRGDGG